MKILKLSPYYFPERISSSHLTEDLERGYIDAGHEIEVICPTPTRGVSAAERAKYKKIRYEEKEGGKIKVHRFPMMREKHNPVLRALRYFAVQSVQKSKGKKVKDVDLIYGGSTPPTQGILCGKVARALSKKQGKKVPFIYNLQDVFPDSLVTTGLAKKGGLLWKIGRKIENKTYANADKIIVISEDIKKNIMDKGVPEEKIALIGNWIDTETVRPIPYAENKLAKELGIADGKFRVVYAGNLGLAQGVDTLISAAKLLENEKEIEFLIFGRGAAEAELKKQAEGAANIRFFPLQPVERVPEVYSLGDACAVLCKAGTGGAGLPSKTWSIMGCGRPLLLSFDDGELTDTVKKANAGLCAPAEDAEALAENVKKLAKEKELTRQLGENARAYAVAHTGKEQAIEKYLKLLDEALGEAR